MWLRERPEEKSGPEVKLLGWGGDAETKKPQPEMAGADGVRNEYSSQGMLSKLLLSYLKKENAMTAIVR